MSNIYIKFIDAFILTLNNYYEIINLTKKNITKYKTKNVNVQYKYHNDVQETMVRLRCI